MSNVTVIEPRADADAALPAVEAIQPDNMPTVTTESASIIQMIERASRDPNVDIDKFERLMAMKERVEAKAAERAFDEALARVEARIPQIVRAAENKHTKSRYARLEHIMEKVSPIITGEGFSLSYGMADCPLPNHYRVTCIVSRSGHSRFYQADLPIDNAGSQGKANKTGIQAFGSTTTYGRRYLVQMIFDIVLTDDPDDDDGNRGAPRNSYPDDDGPQYITAGQVDQIRELLVRCNANIPAFLGMMKVEREDQIPAARFDYAVGKLNQKLAMMEKEAAQ
jgi:hypothetical protein